MSVDDIEMHGSLNGLSCLVDVDIAKHGDVLSPKPDTRSVIKPLVLEGSPPPQESKMELYSRMALDPPSPS